MVRDNQSEENDNLNKVIHNIEIELVKIYDQKAKGHKLDVVRNGWNMGKKMVTSRISTFIASHDNLMSILLL
jgi:predicted nucleotide-binding protein (sugar kinase/HSP70/actin superfamily)